MGGMEDEEGGMEAGDQMGLYELLEEGVRGRGGAELTEGGGEGGEESL